MEGKLRILKAYWNFVKNVKSEPMFHSGVLNGIEQHITGKRGGKIISGIHITVFTYLLS
jgi:hypothetical protein